MNAQTIQTRWRTALVLFVALAPAGPAGAAEMRSRFGYCAPPFAPPCAAAASRNGGATAACEKEVERYVASVFAYRGCLAAETERAVREANETIQALRCAKDAALCPVPEPEAERPKGKGAKSGKKDKDKKDKDKDRGAGASADVVPAQAGIQKPARGQGR
jgi:hypothetical protein